MARKVIELPDELDEELARLAETRGESESELILGLLERYVAEAGADDVITDPVERAAIFEAGAGMWKDRTDIPDVRELWKGWGNRLSRLFGEDE